MKRIEQIQSVQEWLPIDKFLNKGIIKLKDASYIKVLRISPINYSLKSDLEKEAILNSYKNLFKSCNFNLQILIQSKKEDLSKNIEALGRNKYHVEIKEKYIEYVKKLNEERKSSNKNYYLIIKETSNEDSEELKIKNLQNKYIKLKDSLSRCGNIVSEYTDEKSIVELFYSLFNSLKF